MRGRTHIALALVAGQLIYPPVDSWGWLALVIGSVAPDLDSGGGIISRPSAWLPRFMPGRRLLDAPSRVVSRATRAIAGHRGPLHYPVVAIGLWVGAVILRWPWLPWLAFGYAVHILADGLTKAGIPWLGPLSRKHWGLLPKRMRLRTGGAVECVIELLAWSWLGVSLWQRWGRRIAGAIEWRN